MAPFILYQLSLLRILIILYNLNLCKQANRTDNLKTRCRDIPAAGAGRLPAHLQGDIMPPIREQGRKPTHRHGCPGPPGAAEGADQRLLGLVTESEQFLFPLPYVPTPPSSNRPLAVSLFQKTLLRLLYQASPSATAQSPYVVSLSNPALSDKFVVRRHSQSTAYRLNLPVLSQ